MDRSAIENPGRRKFLCAAPVAAAAGLALGDGMAFALPAPGQGAMSGSPEKFQLFTAQTLQDNIDSLQASPGNDNLVESKNFLVILTVEKAKSAKEFEWHEQRDHVFQILDGSTIIQVGGTPKNGRNIRPGEWLAPESEGATTLTLHKGDMLVIPRGTPHKRSTPDSVTLTLISPQGTA